jgi:hypothetical protein
VVEVFHDCVVQLNLAEDHPCFVVFFLD